MQYVKGEENVLADALSRYADPASQSSADVSWHGSLLAMQEMEEILRKEEKEEKESVWISVVTRRVHDTKNPLLQGRWSELNDSSADLAESDSSGETRTYSQAYSNPSFVQMSSPTPPSPRREISETGFPERKDGDRSENFSTARQSRSGEYDPSEVSSHHASDRF